MKKNVITEETLSDYLEAVKGYDNNFIKLEEFNEKELLEKNITSLSGKIFKISGWVKPFPPQVTANFLREVEAPQTTKEEENFYVRLTYYSDTEFCGLSAVEGSSIIIDNIPKSPIGLESGTVYISGGCLRIV